ncbi:MAG: UbiA family prenyltransferase [Chthoniobacteraceae bacterium]
MPFRPFQLLKKCGTLAQTFSIYGACGIVCFGWMLSSLLDFDCRPYAMLWFSSALFIYNLDRLKTDPADPINIPQRSRTAARYRKISAVVAVLAAVAILVIPLLERDLLMSALTIGGCIFCVNYSIPLLGFRFKDIPLLKTFFAPTLVTAAFLIPPLLEQSHGHHIAYYIIAAAWTWSVLMFNMILCDLRDITGDTALGIKSLPVALGHRRTLQTLVLQLFLITFLSVVKISMSAPRNVATWCGISLGVLIYLTMLLVVVRKSKVQPESFYEWWVEGILFVPAVIYCFAR